MKTKLARLFLLPAFLLSACSAEGVPATKMPPPAASSSPPAPTGERIHPTVTASQHPIWIPEIGDSLQWTLSEENPNLSMDVDIYDLDLFDTSPDTIAALHAEGKKVICYISAGSWEDWREDAGMFPEPVIGKDYEGWEGEKWLDIRQIDLLAPIMRARLDLCAEKGFDGVEPDNIDGYANETGFPLTYEDQLRYNRWFSEEAHRRGLSIGLKNDDEQVEDLLSEFDWALVEDCFADEFCEAFLPFIHDGKAVFDAEYTDSIDLDTFLREVCSPENPASEFTFILKNRNLDDYLAQCP